MDDLIKRVPPEPPSGNEVQDSLHRLSGPSINSRCKPMPEKHKEAIRKMQTLLVEDLDVAEIIDYMMQGGIINDQKRDEIMSRKTRTERAQTFLDILKRSGSNSLPVFQESLMKSSMHLWDALQTQLDAEEEAEYFKYKGIMVCKNAAAEPPLTSGNDKTGELSSDEHATNDEIYESYPDLSGYDTDDGYINSIARMITEDVRHQQTSAATMVCKETCTAQVKKVLHEPTFSEPFSNFLERPLPPTPSKTEIDSEKSEETATYEDYEIVTVSQGDFLFLDQTEGERIQVSGNSCFAHVRVWDKNGRLLRLPFSKLKMYGDPIGELWFYPVSVFSNHVDLILGKYKKPGVFLVYKPLRSTDFHTLKHLDKVVFNLAVVTGQGNKYITVHYPIKGLAGGSVMLDHVKFSCIQDLVTFYKSNRGSLPCRLRHPPCEMDKAILPGDHYDMKWYIAKDTLEWPNPESNPGSHGEFGKVIKAFKDNIPVAVKFQTANQRIDTWSLEKFLEEAQILTKMDHKNIVQLQGFSMDETPFIVMEYLSTGTLMEGLQAGTVNKSYNNVVYMIKQVLMALQHLESLAYIIHCDVSAKNILIGEARCLKLADFGLARMVSEDGFYAEEDSTIPARHSALEVLQKGWFSTKSDIWSAAVVLWEILSNGHIRPYDDKSSGQILDFLEDGGRLTCPEGQVKDTQRLFKTVSDLCWRHKTKSRPSAATLMEIVSREPKDLGTNLHRYKPRVPHHRTIGPDIIDHYEQGSHSPRKGGFFKKLWSKEKKKKS